MHQIFNTSPQNVDVNNSLFEVKSLLDTVAKKNFLMQERIFAILIDTNLSTFFALHTFFIQDSQAVYFKRGFQSTIKFCLS